MINHPNRSKITDDMIAEIKGMIIRGDNNQSIVAYFGGDLNPARIAEIKDSINNPLADASLTARARPIKPATGPDLPPRPPYPSPRQMLRDKASMRAAADSMRHTVERIQATLAMIDRVLQ